jgi:DNA helicase-2/ATP-dependent DNA helicase PcrA
MKKVLIPSVQQAAFYHWVSKEKGSCVLEAVAGAGKTTTLIEALKLMEGRIFFGAFNKKIAEEIAAKAGLRNGLEVSTMHAAGMRAWRKVADKFCKVDADKCRNIFRELHFRDMQYSILEGSVLKLVSYAKQAAVGVDGSDPKKDAPWMQLIKHFDIECFDERSGQDNTDTIVMLARDLFNKSAQTCKSIIDFDDMIFAPLYFNVTFDKYDWVLVDEAQDTNASRRIMALRMMKPITGRMAAVGDRHQAIYGFTGADADALDLIGDAVNAIRLPLTTTFRCPKAVVAYAHQWVDHIQAADTAPEGIVRYADISTLHAEVQVGDAILCRFNAPLIKNVYQLIAKGIPARVEGREIGAGLKALANRWKVKSIDALLDKLDNFLEAEVAKFTLKENNKAIETVTDKVDCLRVIINRVIAKGTITKPPQLAVIEEIDAIFGGDEKAPVVLLSSIHKSKGREWKKVIWLQTGPSPFAKQPWEIAQEDNLNYVAPTRSMWELVLMQVTK